MIVGIGIDIIEVNRIRKLIDNYMERAYQKIFTEIEKTYCEQYKDLKYEHYAVRFAVKEAFSKAIGIGFSDSFKLNEIGIVNDEKGMPSIILTGQMLKLYGKYKIHLSIAHLKEYAIATVILEDII